MLWKTLMILGAKVSPPGGDAWDGGVGGRLSSLVALL